MHEEAPVVFPLQTNYVNIRTMKYGFIPKQIQPAAALTLGSTLITSERQ